MKTVYIYTLSDPITFQIRYVGKTTNIKQRYDAHISKTRKEKGHKRNWINQLRERNLLPLIEIIDVVSDDDWKFWERYWIGQCRSWGFLLLNHTNGGDGVTFGNKTTFTSNSVPWNKGKPGYKVPRNYKYDFTPWNKGKTGYDVKSKKVLQYDLNGNFIAEYDSCRKAALAVGCITETIRLCCIGKSKSAKKYIWKFK